MDSIMKEFEHLVVKLDDIKSATDNFDENKVIGRGGFGKVYQGEVSHFKGRSVVAFKRLDREFGQGDPEFWKEIMMLSRYTHKNLISLLGFCNEGGEKILMYEHASHGSLDRHLSSTTLTWTRRIKICLDVARGISYLHDDKGTQQRVLHRDIKSSNILLDEKWNAKVSDLGLAKIGPANQQHTALFTTTVGTLGYLDPLYLQIGILTKESDVYSFGVVLFEVLCGRLCFEKKHGENMVQIWKNRYKQQKLDEIIFQELKHQMDPSALEIFSNIAFQCLKKKSHKQRPKMSLVVEILENVLEVQELHDQLKKYEEMVKVAVDPLKYGSLEELKVLFSNGVILSSAGKRRLSINDKGEHIERIYIESCLNPTETKDDSLQHPSDDYVNSRFPGRLCHVYQFEFNARVRAEYLSPEISYTVNLVFRYRWEHNVHSYNPLKYKIDGEDETRVFIIYPSSHMREDGWFVVPLYQFTSQHTTLHLDITFEECWKMLLVAGIEFQPSEEKVEHQVVEEYQDIVKAASQSLVYQSLEELKEILSKGVHLNGYKTWLSLNKNGEQCHMISMAECLISDEDFTSRYESHYKSRFPTGLYQTNNKGFKTHVKTQLLSPLITYTVNLVFKSSSSVTQVYVDLKYRLRGETTTSTVYLANRRKDDCLFMAELYQFTSGSIVDLEISFDDHGTNIEGVEGILFQPLEKVEDMQTISDSGIRRLSSYIENQTMEMNLYSIIEKWFRFNNQEWSYLDENGNKCLMLSARATCSTMKGHSTWCSLPESRFGEALVITAGDRFGIERKIESTIVSLETAYAVYLVYRLPEDQSTFKAPLEVGYGSFAYLVCPRTPVIGPKLDENTSNTVNRPDTLNIIPQQRSDSWMEVKVYEFQTQTTSETISLGLMVCHPDNKDLRGLMVDGIELRPI